MSKVIDFKTPAQLRDELATKDEELKAVKVKLANVSGVNEMLKLQIADLIDRLGEMSQQFDTITKNLTNLQGKLPTLD
jgi:regulator of replication initiation timing